MKKLLVILFGTLLLSSPLALAHMGNEGAEGGDNMGLQFQALGRKIGADIERKFPGLQIMFSMDKYVDTVRNARVVVVDFPLTVDYNGNIQNSVAVNFPATQTIYVNRERWLAILDESLRASIVFHEYLSLAGIEKTGFYPISSHFMNMMGTSESELLRSLGVLRSAVFQCESQGSVVSVFQRDDLNVAVTIRFGDNEITAAREMLNAAGVRRANEVIGFIYKQAIGLAASSSPNPIYSKNFCFKVDAGVAQLSCSNFSPGQTLSLILLDGTVLEQNVVDKSLSVMNGSGGVVRVQLYSQLPQKKSLAISFEVEARSCKYRVHEGRQD